jgi:hypothetical protein
MAGTNIGLRDWLLGWIIPNPTAGSSNTVGIQAVIVVDETGEPITPSAGGVTIADGADVAEGAIADAAATAGGTGTVSAKLRRISAQLAAPLTVQEVGYTFINITTSTTTQVLSGAGVLHSVVVNTKGTIASAIKIYDATSGTTGPICSIDSLNLDGTFYFDAAVSNGIRVITTGTVAPDVTVLYR